MGTQKSRTSTIAADQAMIDGTNKHLTQLPASFSVGSQVMTPAQLITVYQGRITAEKAVVTAEATHAAAVKANNAVRATTAGTTLAYKQIILAMFKLSPDVLGDFGLEEPKVPVKTAATKAEAATKAKATRKALGTKGKLQKKEALAQESAGSGAPAAPSASPAVSAPVVKPAG
jgi:hypothetical protein